MESMFKNWVLYREDSNTHQEIYFWRFSISGSMSHKNLHSTDELELAHKFDTAGEAYRFAGQHVELQWWRVGKR